MACWNSNLTACFSGITWVLLDYRLAKKISMVGLCSGFISGLVAATPASGFITPHASILLGVVAGVVANFSTKIKYLIKIDDSMDVFAEHGIPGMIGLIFNGFFASEDIVGMDGFNINIVGGQGWVDQNWARMYKQIAYVVACTAYAFVVSALLAKAIDFIPGLKLRASDEAELMGMDDDQLGQFAYDYVEFAVITWHGPQTTLRRQLTDWIAPMPILPHLMLMQKSLRLRHSKPFPSIINLNIHF